MKNRRIKNFLLYLGVTVFTILAIMSLGIILLFIPAGRDEALDYGFY